MMWILRTATILACMVLLSACQSGSTGYAGRNCLAQGHTAGSHAYNDCVDRTYVRDRAFADRFRGP